MNLFYNYEKCTYRLPLKLISVLMAVLMVFSGGLISCYAEGLGLPEKLEAESILSDYAEEIIDLKSVASIDTEKTNENELYLNMDDGSTTVYTFSEPVTFIDENGNLRCKDILIKEQSDSEKKKAGYDYCNGQNDYRINFSSDSAKGVLVEYADIAFSLAAVSDAAAPGYISSSKICNEEFENYEYADLFGTGTLLKYFPQMNGVKEEIVLDENIGRNQFSFKLRTKNCAPAVQEDGSVVLVHNGTGETVQTFAAPFAFDSSYVEGIYDEHFTPECEYAIEKLSDTEYILSVTVEEEWLSKETTVYPVTIDPTTSNLQSGMDVPIHSKRLTSGTSGDNNAVGVSTQYGASRTLVYMGWPSAIQKGTTINSAYYYARELTGRTSGMGIEVYRLTSAWNNNQSWSSRPDWDPKRVDWVNINGNYNGGSTYWYRFNISSVVQAHADGADNRGFMLKYDDEDGSANLRTFAQLEYSTSSMRPYIVINYTNDTTPPTVESVTKTPSSEWSNQDVTVKINGASDSGSGLHQYPYSFSTKQGEYDWHTMDSKTFSQSCRVWVYVWDKAGNINNCAVVDVKIDKTAPDVPSVEADNENWSNGDITLKAKSDDSESGVEAYSFSTAEGIYNWQTEDSKTFSDNATIYIYAKDKAGNISRANTVQIHNIDKTPPAAPVVEGAIPTEWSNQDITLTAVSEDLQSGISEYSFSTSPDKFNWSEENTKTFSSSGTVYVCAKDNAGNISEATVIVIDKVDKNGPVIRNTSLSDCGNNMKITVDAYDEGSGISQYSFDGGKTWQNENTFVIEESLSKKIIYIKVKDNLGNVSSTSVNLVVPRFYEEDNHIGIYNPDPDAKTNIYYRYSPTEPWTKYEKPIVVPAGKKTVYANFSGGPFYISALSSYDLGDSGYDAGDYKDSDTDLSLSYFNNQFDFSRFYKNGEWFFSVNSYLAYQNSLIRAVLPDSSELIFVRKDKYTYVNELNGYTLSVIYNENETEITGYAFSADGISYSYDENGKLTEINNKFNHNFLFNRSGNKLNITDGSGRECEVLFDENGNILSITDPAGGVITYTYENGLLISVKDQANVILDTYAYDSDGVVIKNNDISFEYNENGKISRYVYDRGAYADITYEGNTVAISASDGTAQEITFNSYNLVSSVKDSAGNTTSYEYDSQLRVETILSNGEQKTRYYYDAMGNVGSVSNADGDTVYYAYDETDNNLLYKITEKKDGSTEYQYYDYDEQGNAILCASLAEDYEEDWPERYNEDLTCFEVMNYYDYSNGIMVKDENIAESTVSMYTYDSYGNIIKSANTVNKDNSTIISVTDSTYDVLNRLLSSKSDNSNITYVYDKAGRTLLTNTDGNYQRIVYDIYGRTVQEIGNADYNPSLDNLPDAYTDTSVGHRYEYDNAGNLVKEINAIGIETDYAYSDIGTLRKKSFDIYDYYYETNGSCDRIDVNGTTVIDYDYNVTDSKLKNESFLPVNRITYANGYVEEQRVNLLGNVTARYADGSKYYSLVSSDENSFVYNDCEQNHKITVSASDNSYQYLQQNGDLQDIFSYSVTSDEDTQTAAETHFGGKEYKTIVNESSVDFFTPNSSFVYSFESSDDSAAANILIDSVSILSSNIDYNDTENVLTKSYNSGNIAFSILYDDIGNIISDENNQYTYDDRGELLSSAGLVNASYTYDSRGNMLSKTVNGSTDVFEYANSKWQDQLTSVNGSSLTYDENGNLRNYNGADYEWTHGKWLSTVNDGENTYSYSYDSNGFRTSKTVNGATTNYDVLNGKILAQYNATDNIYFQYSNETPLGFVLNDVQYFYITNLSGDVVGITGANGNVIARYSYDEWGRLLSIDTAEDDNEEQQAIAEINPLRYRGYYYDTETGMYYLQSRYYNPELCRFISADGFDYLNTEGKLNVNAYIYCWNCPAAFDDADGTTPKLSVNLTEIVSFMLMLSGESESDKASGFIEMAEKFDDLFASLKNALRIRYNSFIDKLEYFINYPDAAINSALSKVFNRNFNLKFRLLQHIREKKNINISLEFLKADVDSSEESDISTVSIEKLSFNFADNEKTNNWFEAVLKGLVLGIQLDAITSIFEGMIKTFNSLFDFNRWFESLSSISQDIFSKISLGITMAFNKIFNFIENIFDINKIMGIFENKLYSEIGKWIFENFTVLGGDFFSLYEIFADAFNGYMDGTYRGCQGLMVFILNASIIALTILFPTTPSTKIFLYSIISNIVLNFQIDFDNGHFWG